MVDSSMYQEFVAEAQEFLAELDTVLLKLKDGYDTPDTRIELAGILHNLLESSRFAGLVKIVELSQEMENLVTLIRENDAAFNQENLLLLVEAKEKIVLMVEGLGSHNEERTDIQNIVTRLKEYRAHQKNSISSDSKKENELTDDFGNLFDTFDDEETTFEEPPEIIAALSEEEEEEKEIQRRKKISTDMQSAAKETKTSGTPKTVLEKKPATEKDISDQPQEPVTPPQSEVTDLASLQEEIQSTEQEEELFQIFIQQLRENISLLAILMDNLAEVSDKSQVLSKCSGLISKLHSSANYMGYDRLTDFYGQWIAELEMSDMQLSMGEQVSFDFMDNNLRMVTELFPQIEEKDKEERQELSAGTRFPKEDLSNEEQEETLPHVPALGEQSTESEQKEDDDFSDLFSSFGDFEEEDFEEESVIAALSDDETTKTSPDDKDIPAEDETRTPGIEEKLSHFFDVPEDESPSPDQDPVTPSVSQTDEKQQAGEKRTRRHKKLVTDPASLKDEIESEEYDEELFQIFIDQLQEHISQLRSLANNFSDTQNKAELIKRCSDLLTALHSSANYMGYEKLTEFYGQWIAELEMTDLQLSIGVPFSLDFMDSNINTIIEIFPQIKDMEVDIDLPQPSPTATSPASMPSGLSDNDGIEPIAALSDSSPEIFDKNEEHSLENDEYDDVKAAFTEGDDDVAEDMEFDDIVIEDDEQSLGTDARRKELFERLSGALESLSSDSSAIHDDIRIPEDLAPLHRQPADKEEIPPLTKEEPGQSSPEKEQHLFDRLSRALETEEEMSAPGEAAEVFDEDVDRKLFDKLSDALDKNGFAPLATGLKSIDDVVNEILSGEAVPNEQVSSIPTNSVVRDASDLLTADFKKTDEPEAIESEQKQEKMIRVEAEKIDQLMAQVEELMVSRTHLSQLFHEIDHVQEDLSNAGFLPESLRPLNEYAGKLGQANEVLARIAGEITEGVLSVRKVPIGNLFRQYPGIVKDMVRNTGKKIKFQIQGEDTLLDQVILDTISTPLAHILHNSIEHGIEFPAERKQAGKHETGTLLLEAYPESNAVVIEISDDGAGIDLMEIQKRALELNIATNEQIASMSETEIMRLIMEPGFSTLHSQPGMAETGHGLDKINQTVKELKGAVTISSQKGTGTITRIKIPLVLSVLHAMGINIGSMILTVPVTNIVETTRIRWQDITNIDGVEMITHRGTSMPVFRLKEILNVQADVSLTPYAYILVVQAKDRQAGIIVDGFIRPRETVIKPLAEYLRKESGFSGATILDNGDISLVLDTAALLEIIKNRTLDETRQTQLENALKGMATA